jgi:hypothetical protein
MGKQVSGASGNPKWAKWFGINTIPYVWPSFIPRSIWLSILAASGLLSFFRFFF